jgi:hypothetical protein
LAVSVIGGGGGGAAGARLRRRRHRAPGRRRLAGRSAAWPVAAGAAWEGGDAVAVCGVAAGFSVTCRGACLPDLAAVVRPAADRGFAFVAGCLAVGLAPGTASSACKSTVTCAGAGPAAQIIAAVNRRQACRMRVRLPGNGPGRQ